LSVHVGHVHLIGGTTSRDRAVLLSSGKSTDKLADGEAC